MRLHWHQLRVADFDLPLEGQRVTHVLLRCKCGTGARHLRSLTLDGHFMMDGLLGLKPPAEIAPPAGLALPDAAETPA